MITIIIIIIILSITNMYSDMVINLGYRWLNFNPTSSICKTPYSLSWLVTFSSICNPLSLPSEL